MHASIRFLGPALAITCLLAPVALHGDDTPATRPLLAGAWAVNKSLGTAPGSGGLPEDGMGPGRGRGPGGGGPGGGGMGGGFGGGGMGRRRNGSGPPGGMDRRREDMAARRALMQELMELPPKFTIAQDGDKVVFIEPDGVVRSYVANDKTEKHQLQNGTIETKSKWDTGGLVMELKADNGPTITRRYAVKGDPRQLEITTTFDGGPKDAKRLAVYETAEEPH